MREILIVTAVIAAGGFMTTTATAQTFQPGGPERIGSMCKVVTGDPEYPEMENYGYYAPCGTGAYAEAPVVRHHRRAG